MGAGMVAKNAKPNEWEARSKCFDLKWAREWAGLTQAQAAEKMGVHRDSFSRWETGATEIPTRKLQLFLRLVDINPQDIPKRPEPRRYDSDGYPVGFDREAYELDADAEDAALEIIEGDEFDSRQRERYRLFLTNDNCMEYTPEQVAKELALHDAETARANMLDSDVLEWLRGPEVVGARMREATEARIRDLQARAARYKPQLPDAEAVSDLV